MENIIESMSVLKAMFEGDQPIKANLEVVPDTLAINVFHLNNFDSTGMVIDNMGARVIRDMGARVIRDTLLIAIPVESKLFTGRTLMTNESGTTSNIALRAVILSLIFSIVN